MPSKKLNAWSFSRLKLYQSCAYRAKLQYLDKVKAPDRPKTKKEPANERGSRIHENAELYINGEIDETCYELKHFEDELFCLRIMKSQHPDRVKAEEMWFYDKDWNPLPADAPYEDIWLRIIADLQIWNHDHTVCRVVDFKSGKRERNEITHGRQLQLYQLASFMRFPKLEVVIGELWYIDLNLHIPQSFSREKGLKMFPIFNDQAQVLCSDITFEPHPSVWNCKFCPYADEQYSNKWVLKNGVCKYGVG